MQNSLGILDAQISGILSRYKSPKRNQSRFPPILTNTDTARTCFVLVVTYCARAAVPIHWIPTHLAEIMDWWKMPSLEEDKMHPRLELVHRVQHNLTRLAVCFMTSRLIPLVSFHIMLLFVRRRDKMCLHHLIKLIVRQFHLLKGHNLDVEDY